MSDFDTLAADRRVIDDIVRRRMPLPVVSGGSRPSQPRRGRAPRVKPAHLWMPLILAAVSRTAAREHGLACRAAEPGSLEQIVEGAADQGLHRGAFL